VIDVARIFAQAPLPVATSTSMVREPSAAGWNVYRIGVTAPSARDSAVHFQIPFSTVPVPE
jgi:hypothetical protein